MPENTVNNAEKAPFIVICPRCTSHDVLRDAVARWDVKQQRWDMIAEYDNMTCETCGYESSTFYAIPA